MKVWKPSHPILLKGIGKSLSPNTGVETNRAPFEVLFYIDSGGVFNTPRGGF